MTLRSKSAALGLLTLSTFVLSGCGEIGSPCTPATQAENCPENSFCKVSTGNCDGITIGVCTALPDACTLEFAPVCGCDGETYGNECAADAEGVNVDYDGECGDDGRACGGLQGLECDEGEFCNFSLEAMCGAADQTGICEDIPLVCPEIFAPVCGCDDQTYDNECFANGEGVSVAHEGECENNGAACGGDLDFNCNDGDFCLYADGVCGDDEGVCTPVPEVCTEEVDPVCGCDGETYSNECEANRAGVSVASQGECDDEIVIRECGGLEGLACDEGEFCNFTDGSCGAADQLGICEVIPDVCDDVFDPVCGCDDQTYSNECEAAAAGVSVASESACP